MKVLALIGLLVSLYGHAECVDKISSDYGRGKLFCQTFQATGRAANVEYVKGGKAVAIENALNFAMLACEPQGLNIQRISGWHFRIANRTVTAEAQFTCSAARTNTIKDICPYDDFKSPYSYCYR